jgi:hypothetical protein
LQILDSFSAIADAVLRACLRALGMPGNALAGVLDDSPPMPSIPPASVLQAVSYSGELPSATSIAVADWQCR